MSSRKIRRWPNYVYELAEDYDLNPAYVRSLIGQLFESVDESIDDAYKEDHIGIFIATLDQALSDREERKALRRVLYSLDCRESNMPLTVCGNHVSIDSRILDDLTGTSIEIPCFQGGCLCHKDNNAHLCLSGKSCQSQSTSMEQVRNHILQRLQPYRKHVQFEDYRLHRSGLLGKLFAKQPAMLASDRNKKKSYVE